MIDFTVAICTYNGEKRVPDDWELWFNPNMIIEHFIPKSRFEKYYNQM